MMLEEQIKRARAAQGEDEEENKGLQKKEGEKITLSLAPIAGPGPSTSSSTPDAGPSKPADEAKPLTSISFGSLPTTTPAVSINPLKRPTPVNVFKAAKAPKTDSNGASRTDEEGPGAGKKVYKSEAERLMKEDQARKAMRASGGGGGGGYGGFGPKRDTSAPRRSNF
jgi:DNA/RNA-binding protein KIN17